MSEGTDTHSSLRGEHYYIEVNAFALRGDTAWLQSLDGTWYELPRASTDEITIAFGDGAPSHVSLRWLDEYLEMPGVKVRVSERSQVDEDRVPGDVRGLAPAVEPAPAPVAGESSRALLVKATCTLYGKTEISGSCPFCGAWRNSGNTKLSLDLSGPTNGGPAEKGDGRIPNRCACDEANALLIQGIALCDAVSGLMADWDELYEKGCPPCAPVGDIYVKELRDIHTRRMQFEALCEALLAQTKVDSPPETSKEP